MIYYVLIFVFCWLSANGELHHANVPPRLTKQPPATMAYKIDEEAILPCEASGMPLPRFEWRKDGVVLEIDNSTCRWQQQQPSTVGSIVMIKPRSSSEGRYQCWARNEFGTAISSTTLFKAAVLEPFPTVKQPKVHRPFVGAPLTLKCNPPKSYPPGNIYWGESRPGSKLTPIDNTKRISLDYEGNLHYANVELADDVRAGTYYCLIQNPMANIIPAGFDSLIIPRIQTGSLYFSNIVESDHQDGVSYVCIVDNLPLRSIVQGDDQSVNPARGSPQYVPPQLMWSSPKNELAIRGQLIKMKCIFSGYPTPDVVWNRLDKELSPYAKSQSFGQELVINEVQFSDAGRYQCSANNSMDSATVIQQFELKVESMPFWRHDGPPEDVTVSEDDPAQIRCLADGRPKPTLVWLVNGNPLVDDDPRRTVGSWSINYTSVTKDDIQVFQCNASNEHGYILANAYLNVLAEAPSFTEAPKPKMKFAEGDNVTLTCRVFGAPTPKISWKRTRQQEVVEVSGNQFVALTSGDLLIKNAQLSESGIYECHASNKFGTEMASGELIIRQRTIINQSPTDQTVNISSDVTFRCNATTDSAEMSELKIEWFKNGQKLNKAQHAHILHNVHDNTLTIRKVRVEDSGNYTCRADNGIDGTQVTAKLIVKDRPDAPENVEVKTCDPRTATVAWVAGSDNNDHILEYTLYYNTSYDPPNQFHVGVNVHGSTTRATLALLPWTNYSFHVRARNSLGESEMSRSTESICSTPPATPFRHPSDVCTQSRAENELVILWKPMPRTEHNGKNFHYLVSYKRIMDGSEETKQVVTDWQQSELIVSDQPTFTPYHVYVMAVNNEGSAPISSLNKQKIGYSGHSYPLNIPTNVAVDVRNSSSASFSWDHVDESPEKNRGFFIGYQIRFWKTENPKDVRTEDVILKTLTPCPSGRERRSTEKRNFRSLSERERRTTVERISRTSNKLWPYSNITAAVVVVNGAYKHGNLSDLIHFTTPEGVPSSVPKFLVTESGSHHMVVEWERPDETNGVLTEYVITVQQALGVEQREIKVDDQIQRKKITGLRNNTDYIILISASTSAGRGTYTRLEHQTKASSYPDVPSITDIKSGDNFLVVSWKPSTKNIPVNPGSMFVVNYRKAGSPTWYTTSSEADNNWINVTDLITGDKYEVLVAADNGNNDISKSDVRVITVGITSEPVQQTPVPGITSSDWFIPVICLCALLLLIFVVLCYIHHNRGDDYLVYEKEKKHGKDPGCPEEPEFGEYTRQDKPLPPSRKAASIESLVKQEENDDDDNDSLGEYADPDPSKFNEDGSFIGQYGNKRDTIVVASGVSPTSALTTFV